MATSDKPTSLTKRQREIYEYLKDRIMNRGYGPTVREIGVEFDIKSPNGVMCHLKALEKKGLIRRESNMSRAICLSEMSTRRLSLPFLGAAVSGSPIQAAISSDEHVEFDPMFGGDDKACIRVKGTAFNALSIADGDYIIVQRDVGGENGSLVAALDDHHNLTLYRQQSNGQKSPSANGNGYTGPTRQILGIVVGIIRQFDSLLDGEISKDGRESESESVLV